VESGRPAWAHTPKIKHRILKNLESSVRALVLGAAVMTAKGEGGFCLLAGVVERRNGGGRDGD
jgi:hypothetical protein